MTLLGVAGAGTMGAGIARLAERSGLATVVHDPARPELARLEDLAPCDVVIEAAPEDLELKRALFARLAEVVAPACVLATNTSSLSVSAIAAGVPGPERVVGMHFFNPPEKMRLVEVVAGDESGEPALARARELAAALGREAIAAADGPGFIVNRCNRPFGLEALRLVQERIATPEQVDRICRMAGGFRMGPFELMDLVGLDVGLAVSRSFYEQSFGEPRWRPSPLAARMVAAGRLGRKSGRGWYEYPPGRPADPEPPEPGGGDGRVAIVGDGAVADELRDAAAGVGWEVAGAGVTPADDIVGVGLPGGARLTLCDRAPAAGGTGFHLLPPFGRLVELTGRRSPEAERFFATLGMHAEWVGDAPGLVLGRIVAQLVNEACFALGEGIGSAADIDAGMVLGLNHPRGPLEWGALIGLDRVLARIDALHGEYREERYRPAPALLRRVRSPDDD